MKSQSGLVIIAASLITLGGFAQAQKPVKHAKEVYNGANVDVWSPDHKSLIRCRVPRVPDQNGDDNARIYVVREKRTLNLGTVVRSGEVFWRPDSKLAIFDDDEGSNYSEFRIVRVSPELRDIKSAYKTVRARWVSEFKAGEILHDYTRGQGWLSATDLLISVYADALPVGKVDGPGLGFCRGFVLDTETLKIKREVSRQELKRDYGLDVCW